MIFDSGTVYDEASTDGLAMEEFLNSPFGQGYSTFMKGCVVDMLHFPLVDWNVPESWPLIGGKHIEFLNIFSMLPIRQLL
jgi:signal peptidase II